MAASLYNYRDFDAFINFDADVSARRTKVALAVVREKDESGVKRDTLQIIDLKQASIWKKISLWWNSSLKRKTIGNYLSMNVQNWSREIGDDKKLRSDFELQCAKLHRKIIFTHKPEAKLEITFKYPDLAHPETTLQTRSVYTVDRLTTNQQIVDIANSTRFSLQTNNMSLSPQFGEIFTEKETSGDFPNGHMGTFFTQEDELKDRACTITYKAPSQEKLMGKIAEASVNQGRREQQQQHEYERALRQEARVRARADERNAALTGAAVATTLAAGALILGGAGRPHHHCHRRYR